MADLQNEFSWSFSRQQTFESCARRYYLRYYTFWEGWSHDAPERSRKAYFFSKMQSLPMLIGSAVHETIEKMLRSRARGRRLEDPTRALRDLLNARWKASRDRHYEEIGPKRAPPLFEHYYEQPISTERLARLRDLALRSLDNVQASELWGEILGAGPENWRVIEELATIPIAGVPAFVAPDFAFQCGEELWIVDWKTGAERADLALQLGVYALYAHREFEAPLDRLRAFDYFTAEDRIVEVEIDDAALERAEQHVADGVARMQAALLDADANQPAEESAYAPTEDARECRFCFFQEICPESRAEAPPAGEGQSSVAGAGA